jgi:hypothetical protein
MSFDYNYLKLFLILLIDVIAIALNLLIIKSVIMNSKMRNFENILIFSIALADFFIDSVTVPLFLISLKINCNRLLSSIRSIAHFSFLNISFLSIILVSANRIKKIKFPLYKIKYEKIIKYLLILLIWIIPLISWSISITINTNDEYFINEQLYLIFKFSFVLLSDLFAFTIPTLIYLIFQFIIFYSLKKQEKIKSNEILVIPKLVVINSFQGPPIETNITAKFIAIRNKRAFRILIINTLGHFLLWLPWLISWPIQAYAYSASLTTLEYEATLWILYLNTVFNPIILVASNREFRLLLKLFLIKILKIFKLY